MTLSENLSETWGAALADTESRYQTFITQFHQKKQNGQLENIFTHWDTDGLAIFGLGQLGMLLTLELLSAGIKPRCIIENRPEMNGGRYMDIPVMESRLVWSSPWLKTVVVTAVFDFQTIRNHLLYYNSLLGIVSLEEFL